MTRDLESSHRVAVQPADDDGFKRYLQPILNEHHATAYSLMDVPESRKYAIRVTDEQGSVVGGALVWAYWGWLEVSLAALEKPARGRGLGRRMMVAIEEKARQDGCGRIRVETFGNEKGLYEKMGYRIVGELDDYPEGYTHCWIRKGLDL